MPINDRNLVNKQILDVKGKSVGGIKIYRVSHKVVTSKSNIYARFITYFGTFFGFSSLRLRDFL